MWYFEDTTLCYYSDWADVTKSNHKETLGKPKLKNILYNSWSLLKDWGTVTDLKRLKQHNIQNSICDLWLYPVGNVIKGIMGLWLV